jgi:hypothetical protein
LNEFIEIQSDSLNRTDFLKFITGLIIGKLMNVVVSNFYLLDDKGRPKIICENYTKNESVIRDKIFQMSIARIARFIDENYYKLEYRQTIHYITRLENDILVIGFNVDTAAKNLFVANMNNVMESFNFQIYGIEYHSAPSDFQETVDILISQLFDRFEELNSEGYFQIDVHLADAITIS